MQVLWCPHPRLVEELLQGEVDDVRGKVARVVGLESGREIRGLDLMALREVVRHATRGWIRLLPSLERFEGDVYGM
jgi:hypothetical protein